MPFVRALVMTCLICSCSGSDDPVLPDASATVDAPLGGACTGAAYDPCTTNDQCASMNCKFFNQSAFTVCTASCTPGDNSTCPTQNGMATATCNMMGICKPAVANNCTR